MAFRWTKFQDFYLRLGFLKVLVSVLDRERTSVANDLVFRRLRTPLFERAASKGKDLWDRVETKFSWYATQHKKHDYSKPTIAEALLVDGDCGSFLFAVTEPTIYKVLDWGKNVGLVGRGNQVTERGLLLRALMPRADVESFLGGDLEAWNPFRLQRSERAFFLYHLGEIDHLTLKVVEELGNRGEGEVLELRDAGRIVCRCFHEILDEAEDSVRPTELPRFRTARDLATAMADEMEMPELVDDRRLSRARLRPKPKPISRNRSKRKLTKNTDHQTVPRLEQLTDLGFVRKQGAELDDDARRRWKWIPTPLCREWRRAMTNPLDPGENPLVNVERAIARVLVGREGGKGEGRLPADVGERVWRSYEEIKRPVGFTPLESIALHAALTGVEDGVVIEVEALHEEMLELKRTSALSDHLAFAGGNDLERMFVRMRRGFAEAYEGFNERRRT